MFYAYPQSLEIQSIPLRPMSHLTPGSGRLNENPFGTKKCRSEADMIIQIEKHGEYNDFSLISVRTFDFRDWITRR